MRWIFKHIGKLLYFEPIIIWIRYLKTIKFQTYITNVLIPILVSMTYMLCYRKKFKIIEIDLFTISSILIGFCSSILIMLYSIEGNAINKLKSTMLGNKYKISLYEALIYKFSFINLNLIVLLLIEILGYFFVFRSNLIYFTIVLFLLLNILMTFIESLTNVVFGLKRS